MAPELVIAVLCTALMTGALPLTVTLMPGEGVSVFRLSSVARLLIVTEPVAPGVQLYVQVVVPLAGCHVFPPSTDTSMPATIPPPSLAVPDIVTALPDCTVAPEVGELMEEIGGLTSVEAEAGINPDCSVAGCTPISARRFTVACCMAGLAAALPFV